MSTGKMGSISVKSRSNMDQLRRNTTPITFQTDVTYYFGQSFTKNKLEA